MESKHPLKESEIPDGKLDDTPEPGGHASSPEREIYLARLAGGLAHEIKNPLSTMSINLALLEEEFVRTGRSRDSANPELSARERRCMKRVQTVQREISRLELILEDFLLYARGGEVNRSPQNLLAVLREVLEFVETEDELQEIRHHIEMPSSLPLAIVDVTAMRQALLNLVVNARQAMPMGGELIVRARRQANHVVLTITDTGVGMTPEDLEHCFTPYWSTKKNGTGLGLATTQRIIQQHEGTISVVSELGRGTSFKIVLPLVVEITGTPERDDVEEAGE
jgi:two-component system, NtrC family, sensor histidine kinase HydH